MSGITCTHVAQALVPAVSRLVSTRLACVTRCRTKSVPMSGDAAGTSACATSSARTTPLAPRSPVLTFSMLPLRVFLRASASPRQIIFLALFGSLVLAQQQQIPHAGYAYPAGGRQGTTFEVTVGGQFLDGVKSALVSGAGVEAAVVEHVKPLTPAQAGELRDQVKELSEKPNPTAEDRQKIAEIRAKLIGFVRRPTTPAIAETVRVQIVLSADAPLGERELRLVTPNGLTNPVMFCVGQLPEVGRPPAKGTGQLPGAQAGRGRGPARPAPEPPLAIHPTG